MTAKRLAKSDALCFERLDLRLMSNDHEPLRAEMSSANKTNSPPSVLGRILRSYPVVDKIKISCTFIATILILLCKTC
jgi:enoyl reductase-like protein